MRLFPKGVATFCVCVSIWASGHQAAASPYGSETVQDASLEIRKKIPPKKLHKLLIGTWTVRAPDAIRRQIDILALAIDPESKRASLDALTPSEEATVTYEAFQMLALTDPNAPELAEARSRIEALNDNHLLFTADTSTMQVAGSERHRSYRVIRAYPNLLRIFWIEANETNECVFVDQNHVRIFADNEEKVRLERN